MFKLKNLQNFCYFFHSKRSCPNQHAFQTFYLCDPFLDPKVAAGFFFESSAGCPLVCLLVALTLFCCHQKERGYRGCHGTETGFWVATATWPCCHGTHLTCKGLSWLNLKTKKIFRLYENILIRTNDNLIG